MKNRTKIYTRTGDDGETSLLGGTRVPKFHKRIEAYGTIDELNSHIGLLRDIVSDNAEKTTLLQIQKSLLVAESQLAAENEKALKKIPSLNSENIVLLENEIDRMNCGLPELKSFIIPGGHPVVSQCHIARCVCRRAERTTIELAVHFDVDKLVIRFLNRLSDYLFILGRKLTQDLKAEEIQWTAKL
jgi:cob(I)alamin adenosyltransferase